MVTCLDMGCLPTGTYPIFWCQTNLSLVYIYMRRKNARDNRLKAFIAGGLPVLPGWLRPLRRESERRSGQERPQLSGQEGVQYQREALQRQRWQAGNQHHPPPPPPPPPAQPWDDKDLVCCQVSFGSSLSSGSLHSDGDSYPNSPINGEDFEQPYQNRNHIKDIHQNQKGTVIYYYLSLRRLISKCTHQEWEPHINIENILFEYPLNTT